MNIEITKIEVIPSPIENASVNKILVNGVHIQYEITPIQGYVLHNTARDWTRIDEASGEKIEYKGYSHGASSCSVNYDFEKNLREFYAVLVDDIEPEYIF